MTIIGVVGTLGSGKGTIGDILIKNHGFIADSFAAPLKDAASCIFGWDRALLEGDTKESREFREKECPLWSKYIPSFTPRKALQLLGTESVREVFHNNIWIISLESRLQAGKNYVITDVRFPNEIDFIRRQGGLILEARRGDLAPWYQTASRWNNADGAERAKLINITHTMADLHPEVHSSEWAWMGLGDPIVVENNGTLEELERKITNIILAKVDYLDF